MDPFEQRPSELPQTPFFGLDFGKKVVGIAYFHPAEDSKPMGYGRIIYQSDEQVIKELMKYTALEGIQNLVLGLPLYPDGNQSKMSERVVLFAQRLVQSLPSIKLFCQDESGTTREAQEKMKSSGKYQFQVDLKKLDELSATIILERFIASFSKNS